MNFGGLAKAHFNSGSVYINLLFSGNNKIQRMHSRFFISHILTTPIVYVAALLDGLLRDHDYIPSTFFCHY